MSKLPTVRVVREGGTGYRLINESDFDPEAHQIYGDGETPHQGGYVQSAVIPVLNTDNFRIKSPAQDATPQPTTIGSVTISDLTPTQITLSKDWQGEHWKTRVKLASDLTGKEFSNKDEADAAILKLIDEGKVDVADS
ncbi:hypothetical protein [Roseibium sp. RKSG952]|uniref:hypothetical protein n=1 Tax=Roseibium sp. RKSG952 TaxID=2529384 RepID=UPI0012BB92EE|nr:hypothetical protein [Roseibium sp. RKSG952]MTH96414.1 hypothetical protein [Roseibium sp. RKSG952]